MILIVLGLIVIGAAQPCPSQVNNQLQLISLPLNCFHQLYDSSIYDGHKVSRVINERLQIYKRMLQEIKMHDWQYEKTTPVLKWAQSESQIFISFKLSHRQDSPTCSDIRSQFFQTWHVTTTQGNIPYEIHNHTDGNFSSLQYKGECYFTSQKFLFTLRLHFQAHLHKITLRKEGLGLYTLIGDKVDKSIWATPFNDFKKAAIWPELRQKYEADMNKFFEMIEDTESSTKKKRKRRPKSEQRPQAKQQGRVEERNDQL